MVYEQNFTRQISSPAVKFLISILLSVIMQLYPGEIHGMLQLAPLKNSLAQLKIKLSTLEEKLKILKQKIGKKVSFGYAEGQSLALKEIVISSKAEIAQKFKEITDGKVPVALIVDFDVDSDNKHFEFNDKNVNPYIKKIKFNIYPTWGHIWLNKEDESAPNLELNELDISALSSKTDDLVLNLTPCPKRLILCSDTVFRQNLMDCGLFGGGPEFVDLSKCTSAEKIFWLLRDLIPLNSTTTVRVPSAMKAAVEKKIMQEMPIKIVD
ncbi:MAG: hypothetical protein V1646_04815 [bacterium]